MMISRAGSWIKKKKPINGELGFTLLELLITVAVAAIFMGLAVSYLSQSFSTQAKSEVSHFQAVVKYVYNEAVIKNATLRIVFDLDNEKYWVEEAEDAIAAKEEVEPSKKSKSSFNKKKEEIPEEKTFTKLEEIGLNRELEESVKIREVFLEQQEEPVREGMAYLYFFSGGQTQNALVVFSNEDEDQNYSMIVNPINGSIRVVAEYVEGKDAFEE